VTNSERKAGTAGRRRLNGDEQTEGKERNGEERREKGKDGRESPSLLISCPPLRVVQRREDYVSAPLFCLGVSYRLLSVSLIVYSSPR